MDLKKFRGLLKKSIIDTKLMDNGWFKTVICFPIIFIHNGIENEIPILREVQHEDKFATPEEIVNAIYLIIGFEFEGAEYYFNIENSSGVYLDSKLDEYHITNTTNITITRNDYMYMFDTNGLATDGLDTNKKIPKNEILVVNKKLTHEENNFILETIPQIEKFDFNILQKFDGKTATKKEILNFLRLLDISRFGDFEYSSEIRNILLNISLGNNAGTNISILCDLFKESLSSDFMFLRYSSYCDYYKERVFVTSIISIINRYFEFDFIFEHLTRSFLGKKYTEHTTGIDLGPCESGDWFYNLNNNIIPAIKKAKLSDFERFKLYLELKIYVKNMEVLDED